MTTSHALRTTFLDFFKNKGHEVVGSSPLVPQQDPTLMFTNSGMVQFKNVFTGLEQRAIPRATTAQKCVRAGGKHNDLENVGFTARHHTFFEMLGNFSFGDYFKEEAITYAWELISKVYGLSKDKLLVTVFSQDDEAFNLWKKVAGFSEDRIIRIPTSDNFWSMGDTGPCGPCSEIFYDHGSHIAGGPPGSPDQDGDRFVEIWNLVFMQFEQISKDERVGLPKPSIDTGMGLERLAAIMQGVHNNYDTDIFASLIEASKHFSGNDRDDMLVSHRVIADHLRSSSFLIADGVMPSNEGRGYVLRRIMRRAMRHAHLLGAKDPLLYKLVPTLVEKMGASYPELERAQSLTQETLRLEEERFRLTLDRGLKLLDEACMDVRASTLSGDVAFKLYDTFGFPIDLTETILKSKNLKLDQKGFEDAMARQKAEARASWAGSGELGTEKLWFELKEQFGSTEFLGYDTESAEGQILALGSDGTLCKELKTGQKGFIIMNQTPFYGESGGQMGDTGVIENLDSTFYVTDTHKKAGGLFVHFGEVKKGVFTANTPVKLTVDGERRTKMRANHSATHLLHEALRQRLGDRVTQKGSLVTPDKLRFDFSYAKALSAEDIAGIEDQVNAEIRANHQAETHLMDVDAAQKTGAMALFGEKYDDIVRVVSMGTPAINGKKAYSVELCGGTHVSRTGDIGLFKMTLETSVASGIRRIEALTGKAAFDFLRGQEQKLLAAADQLKTTPDLFGARLTALMDEKKKLERDVMQLKQAALKGGSGAEDASENIAGVKVVSKIVQNTTATEMRTAMDHFKKTLGTGIVILVAQNDDKAALMVGVTADLTARYDAVNLVRIGVEILGGKGGGGRADLAQSGGTLPGEAENALAVIKKAIGV